MNVLVSLEVSFIFINEYSLNILTILLVYNTIRLIHNYLPIFLFYIHHKGFHEL